MSGSSDIRRITTYGKQRIKYTSSRRDWDALMSSGASQIGSASSSHANVSSNSKTWVTPAAVEDHVNNNVETSFEAPRRRAISIDSSTASPSATSVLAKVKKPVKTAGERVLVISSDESGDDDEYVETDSDASGVAAARKKQNEVKPILQANPARRRPILVRKDSNLVNTASPLTKLQKASHASTPATVESSKLNDTFARPMLASPHAHLVQGKARVFPQSQHSIAQQKKTVMPRSTSPTKSAASLPYLPSHARGSSISIDQRAKYITPAYKANPLSVLARLPSTGFLSPRPLKSVPLSRSRMSSSSSHGSSSTRASSSTTKSSSSIVANAKMHVAPPRGHGTHADVSWRRPLAPLTIVGLAAAAPSEVHRRTSQSSTQPSDRKLLQTRKESAAVLNSAVPDTASIVSDGSSRQTSAKSAVTPTDATDMDVTTHLQSLHLQQAVSPCSSPAGSADALDSLLTLCGSDGEPAYVRDFTDIVGAFPLVLASETQPLVWSKISEATYSEVFMCSQEDQTSHGVVVKIIPLQKSWLHIDESQLRRSQSSASSSDTSALPFTSTVQDVERELRITKALQHTTGQMEFSGFTKLLGTYVVSGRYPAPLTSAWETFREAKPNAAENASPAAFGDDQHYALICLEHAGEDLETVKIRNFVDAACVFWQIASSLAVAEKQHRFEHRDLHWGNVLVQATDEPMVDDRPRPACLAGTACKLRSTIIDFTLSRIDAANEQTVYSGFDDDELFTGKGDFQYECYRHMRIATRGDWHSHTPVTNVIWLRYLVGKLLRSKRIRKPAIRAKAAPIILASGPCTPRKTRGGRSAAIAVRPVAKRAIGSTSDERPEATPETQAYDALCTAEAALAAAVEDAVAQAGQETEAVERMPGLAQINSAHSFVERWLAC